MLNKELSQFSDSSKSGNQISKYILTFLDKEHDLDTSDPSPSPGGRKHTPSPDPTQYNNKRKIMNKITLHQVQKERSNGRVHNILSHARVSY